MSFWRAGVSRRRIHNRAAADLLERKASTVVVLCYREANRLEKERRRALERARRIREQIDALRERLRVLEWRHDFVTLHARACLVAPRKGRKLRARARAITRHQL